MGIVEENTIQVLKELLMELAIADVDAQYMCLMVLVDVPIVDIMDVLPINSDIDTNRLYFSMHEMS